MLNNKVFFRKPIEMMNRKSYMRNFKILTPLALVCAIVACTPGVPAKYDQPQVVADPDKVSAQLVQAADKASTALQTLATIEQTRTPNASTAPFDNVPVELRRAITINWVGPVESVAKTVANRASYGFSIVGEGPPTTKIVNLDVENKPIIDVLRAIGLQLGRSADIVVDANARMVELQYQSQIDPSNPF